MAFYALSSPKKAPQAKEVGVASPVMVQLGASGAAGIHLDAKKLAGFERVGHRITGNRLGRNGGVGYDFFHVAIDDATRLA